MAHLLLIKDQKNLPVNLQRVIDISGIQVIEKNSVQDVVSILERDGFSLTIIIANQGPDHLSKSLFQLKKAKPDITCIVVGTETGAGMRELAFRLGASLYFNTNEPIENLDWTLQKLLSENESDADTLNSELLKGDISKGINFDGGNHTSTPSPKSALQTLRDFSQVLGYSLDYKAFIQHFILKLRDHVSFSRIAIFLEDEIAHTFQEQSHSKSLSCAASFGIPSDLANTFKLSWGFGIGKTLAEQPRVIQKGNHSNRGFRGIAPDIEKEFSILGCRLAIPISDRERIIGIAVLNGPLTRADYFEEELELLYLLMEELGLAIKNSRLHKELSKHVKLVENVLSSMQSGAIVFSEKLEIIYCNDAAKRFIAPEGSEIDSINWENLPKELASSIHQAVEKGKLPAPFQIQSNNAVHRISIIPFTENNELGLLPVQVMVLIEDFTQIEANKHTAIEESRSNLIQLIAKRFAHEIRNSLVPMSTHAQLFSQKIKSSEFQASLHKALTNETERIKRFSDQMLYLATDSLPARQDIAIQTVLLDAFGEAKKHCKSASSSLKLKLEPNVGSIYANREAITCAFEEIFINALQLENSKNTTDITVDVSKKSDEVLYFRIRDNGAGFTETTARKAFDSFYSTQNRGIGLGLTIAKKIITEHQGTVSANVRTPEKNWDMEVELPFLNEN